MFITFEGGEGVGKSTQIRLLSAYLQNQHIPHITTREPGGTDGGMLIRQLLVDPSMPDWDPMTEYMLLLADRNHHVRTVIRPALEKRMWVLCDRFQDSSWVYQGWVKGLDCKQIERIYDEVLQGFYPHKTFILDIPAQIAQERVQSRGNSKDRFELEHITFHERVREGYLEIAKRNSNRCRLVDADQTIDYTQRFIMTELDKVTPPAIFK